VAELRVKESDRLTAIETGLAALGVETDVEDDVLTVVGGTLGGNVALDSLGDHRLAMAWWIAGLAADAPVTIGGFDAVAVSYPGFEADMAHLTG
jgi:3-phosphoshikimate 1-carboxyvinyltransferase